MNSQYLPNDEAMKNKKQEDAGPSRGEREVIRRAGFLIHSSALSYYLAHEFYNILLAHASSRESIGDDSAANGYGFGMYMRNTERSFGHTDFNETVTGLGGFGNMIVDAVRWIDDEIKYERGGSDFSSKMLCVSNPRRVDDELDDDPVVLRNMIVFAEAWEALAEAGRANGYTVNMFFSYYPDYGEMPKELFYGELVFQNNDKPDDVLEMFQNEVEKMKEAIENGPYPECPGPPEDYGDDE